MKSCSYGGMKWRPVVKIFRRINSAERFLKSTGMYLLVLLFVIGFFLYKYGTDKGIDKVVLWIIAGTVGIFAIMWIVCFIVYYMGNEENRKYIEKALADDKPREPQTIEYLLTEKDYIETHRLYMWRNPSNYVSMIAMTLIMTVVCIVLLIIKLSPVTLVVLAVGLFFVLYPYTGMIYKLKKLYKIQKTLNKPVIITCDGVKLTTKGENFGGEIDNLYDIAINGSYLILFLTPVTFLGIKRTFFKDEEQFDYFVKTAYGMINREKGLTF